jgi:hypothetical protein
MTVPRRKRPRAAKRPDIDRELREAEQRVSELLKARVGVMTDLNYEIDPSLNAELHAHAFLETRDPWDAYMSYREAYRAGVRPDEQIVQWFGEGLFQWGESEGKERLEHILGLSGGKTPAFKDRLLKARDQMLFLDMARLRTLPCRLTIEEAAILVADRLAKTKDWNKSAWPLDQPGAGTLLKRYSKWPPRKATEEFFRRGTSKCTREEVGQYLSQFPTAHQLPKLKLLLPTAA